MAEYSCARAPRNKAAIRDEWQKHDDPCKDPAAVESRWRKAPQRIPGTIALLTQIFRQAPCYGIPIFCGAINFTNLNATRRRFVSKNWHTKTRSTRTFLVYYFPRAFMLLFQVL
jgi:hypothetical protein